MLALPHHADILQDATTVEDGKDPLIVEWMAVYICVLGEMGLLTLANQSINHPSITLPIPFPRAATDVFKTLKGGMTAVLGDRWYLKVSRPCIGWTDEMDEWKCRRSTSHASLWTHGTHPPRNKPHQTRPTTQKKQEAMPGGNDASGIEFRAPRPIPANKVEAIKAAVRIDLAAIERKGGCCIVFLLRNWWVWLLVGGLVWGFLCCGDG